MKPAAMSPDAGRDPLRIAVAVQSLDTLGGKERDALAIAGGLAARGHRVTLLTRPPASAALAALTKAPAALAIEPVEALAWSNHARARRFAQAAAQIGRDGRFDVVLSFEKSGQADAYYAADVCLAARTGPLKRWLPRYRAYLQLEADCMASGGPDLLFLCRKQADDYLRCYGPAGAGTSDAAARSMVLPPMIHAEPTGHFYGRRDEVRREFGVPSGAPMAVAVAVYGRQKGLDRSIDALRRIGELHLVAVGLKDAGPMAALARRHGLAARVHLDGRRGDVADVLGAADLMLHPARVENTGLVIVESLLAGVPVIASGVCGFGEYIERFGAGTVLAEPFDADAYAAAIGAALAPARLETLRRHARDSAAPLSAEGGLERILDRIEAVLRRRAPDPPRAPG